MLHRLTSFIRAALRRRPFEQGLNDELQFHLDAYAADLRRAGLNAEDAERRARAEFGAIQGVRDDCRQAYGLRTLDWLAQDIRYSLRLVKRGPVFTATAIASLALAIGATTAVFTLIDAVLLRSLPVMRPHELYFIAHGDGDALSTSSNYPLFARYQSASAFDGVTAYRLTEFRVAGRDGTESVAAQFVSGNYHAVGGVPFVLGRGFTQESDRPQGDRAIAVISEAYWTRRFNRAPDVLGRTLTINDRSVTIVGVTGRDFAGFEPGTAIDITVPLSLYAIANLGVLDSMDGFTSMLIVGRLGRGVSESQALAAADGIFQQFMNEPGVQWARKVAPAEYSRARLLPAGLGADRLRQQYGQPLLMLLAIAGLVLVIASTNVANLLLARSGARAGEVALRMCVGAGRGRVVRQLLTESLLLALIAGAAGLLFAHGASTLIVALLTGWQQPLTLDVSLSLRVLVFALVVTVAAGLAFGIVPALRATAADLTPALRAGREGGRTIQGLSLVSRAIIVSQMALCVVVVTAAALLTQSVGNLKSRPGGFDPGRVLLFDLGFGSRSRPDPERRAVLADVLERLRTTGGIASASASTMTPINTVGTFRGLAMAGLPLTPEARGVYHNLVSGQYFETIGIRLLRGRSIDDRDVIAGRRVAILNEQTARYVFGDADPIGRTIAWQSAQNEPLEVIGVVENTRHANLREDAPRMIYTPLSPWPGGVQIAIKTSGGPSAAAAEVRELVRRVDSRLSIGRIRTMNDQVNGSLIPERSLASLSVAFALLAAALAAVGLYGVISFHVAGRTREIGIRLALGEPRHAVLAGVLRYTTLLSLLGIAAGIAAAFAATRLISTFLYGLSPTDPATFAAVSLALWATALAAGYLPARRAARIDPVEAIKAE